MKKKLLLLIVSCISCMTVGAQDFASRFMMEFNQDSTIHCQTISPKMMEKLGSVQRNRKGKEAVRLITKLKSARIITGEDKPEYFRHAEKMLKQNRQRFVPLSQSTALGNNLIFVRQKDNSIIELILLNQDSTEGTFTLINLTGNMDKEFIRILSEGQ